jgi:hypothetical protein
MISVSNITNQYFVQPTLLNKHQKTVEWLSTILLMKVEVKFFQKLLDKSAKSATSEENKKKLDHFQNLVLYYNGELLGNMSTRLRNHEKKLAEMLEQKDETKVSYFKEHDQLIAEMESLYKQFNIYKEELFHFISSLDE